MGKITKEEQERLGKYTHRYKALWDRYFWLKEAYEHRKNTIGLESTPEEKKMIKELNSRKLPYHNKNYLQVWKTMINTVKKDEKSIYYNNIDFNFYYNFMFRD